MKLEDFFKIIEDKHLPDGTIEFRNPTTGDLIHRIININTPKIKRKFWKFWIKD